MLLHENSFKQWSKKRTTEQIVDSWKGFQQHTNKVVSAFMHGVVHDLTTKHLLSS